MGTNTIHAAGELAGNPNDTRRTRSQFESALCVKDPLFAEKRYLMTLLFMLRPLEWAEGVSLPGSMTLLFMPHFGHSLQVNTYVKQLLV